MENSRVKPTPGVEEALFSMLWTPYPDNSSESSSSDESETFKRKKRPLTWAVNDNHDNCGVRPYSISSRLSYPTYYPSSYFTTTDHHHHHHLIVPRAMPQSFIDNFSPPHWEEENRRPTVNSNEINHQTNQQQSGFINFYNNNNLSSKSMVPIPSSNTRREPVFVGGGSSFCPNYQFSCVRVVDEIGSNVGVAQSDHYSLIQGEQKKLNKFIVESTLSGMRTVNMTTTTTIITNNDALNSCRNNTHIYVTSSSSSNTSTPRVLSDATTIKSLEKVDPVEGSLTIPVNQQTSNVNIVNCYRTVPVQIVNEEENDDNSVKENPNTVKSKNLNINNKCDIIEVADDAKENKKSSKNTKLSSSIINISANENLNSITSDNSNDKKYNNTKGLTPFDTCNLDQSIYISSSDQTNIANVDAINSVHDPINVQENVVLSHSVPSSREQRRRERRERRAARSRMSHIHALHAQEAISNPNNITATAQMHQIPLSHAIIGANQVRPLSGGNFQIVPDLLHSHLPPPYTTLPVQENSATLLTTPVPVPVSAVDNCRYSFPLPIIRRSPSERSGKGCCTQWFAFAGPPLRALIAVVALGGVACALGGAALGATSLAGPPQSHFTAALLMIGVGVILVTISGAAWKMTAPGGPPCLSLETSADLGRCNRRACTRSGANGHMIYPEFQHRAPPPSYQASMQEYRLRLLLLDRDRQTSVLRVVSPPPTYRSTSGSLLRTTMVTHNNQSRHQPPSSSTASGRLFGGISEIINGFSYSINNKNNNQNNIENISNNSSEATLPPSYRTRNNHHTTGSHLRPVSAYNNDSNHDFTLTVHSSSMDNLSVNITPSLSFQQSPSNFFTEEQPKTVNSSYSSSSLNHINSETTNEINKIKINENSLNNDNNSNNDLVTIVTISGLIDESENKNSVNDLTSLTVETSSSKFDALVHL
ncbi:uncharacterized protein LOC134828760 [Culicoides brevitarsis]|uniref:uncharacterized protein LOC134828760 n=1 Tax=Culicoides brevitarsis TaxID=469753 RepID=UPI00307B1FC1